MVRNSNKSQHATTVSRRYKKVIIEELGFFYYVHIYILSWIHIVKLLFFSLEKNSFNLVLEIGRYFLLDLLVIIVLNKSKEFFLHFK